jgi:hypothetical protein
MGMWGTGLYSGDFALDLRSTIRAVSRLPFDGEKILAIVRSTADGADANEQNEEHSTFWLVVADQLHRRGIPCAEAQEKALAIIRSGSDIAICRALGMSDRDLRKRAANLEEVRERLESPANSRGPTLKRPQKFVLELGGVYAYPVSSDECINPYSPSVESLNALHSEEYAYLRWVQDGWSALAIVDRGHAFDYLAWYRPLVLNAAIAEKPRHPGALSGFRIESSATLSATHYRRMRLEPIGQLVLDTEKVAQRFGVSRGTFAAIQDISISNRLDTTPLTGKPKRSWAREPYREQIKSLNELLRQTHTTNA